MTSATGGTVSAGPQHGYGILVTIVINGDEHKLRCGRHEVAELKERAGVPKCDELAEVKCGRLHPLDDDGHTQIEGGERFLSSPRSCPAS